MKAILSAALLLALYPGPSSTSGPASYSGTLARGDTLVLELEGDVVLHPVGGTAWRLEMAPVEQERVMGWSNRASRGPYTLRATREGSRVLVEPVPRLPALSLGVTVSSERYRHDVYVPGTAAVTVRSGRANVVAAGRFESLQVQGRTGTVDLRVPQGSSVDCSAPDGTVVVDGKPVGRQFNARGTGGGHYTVRLRAGTISVGAL
ncbi:MAG: hypothetical protein JO040_04265 [Gemmatimonadetes bacterium]|nr:hypothetical protein [Gemmatimonadota bacterium]